MFNLAVQQRGNLANLEETKSLISYSSENLRLKIFGKKSQNKTFLQAIIKKIPTIPK